MISDTPKALQDRPIPKGTRLAGWAALVHSLGLAAPIRSRTVVSDAHVRGSHRVEDGWTIYDKRYWPGNSVIDHLTFALRHEPIDFLILKRALATVPVNDLTTYIEESPTGALARRMWFFYETLTGRTLNIADAGVVPAADALDPKLYFTGRPALSKRHRVRDNLLGRGDFCPVIRRTPVLQTYLDRGLAQKAAETVGRTGSHLIARAASFLLLADSRASFEIEGERPPRSRLERWGRAVLQAGRYPLSLDELDRLHAVLIEDARFIKRGLRQQGVFLGERDYNDDPLPEFIGARPVDLPSLVEGLLATNRRMAESGLDAILQAAATAFGFVYIHPYEDGNGRLHRCLIHHVLTERTFTPPGMVFPVSSVMLDRIDSYRDTLQGHSGPLMDFIEWRPTPEHNVEVVNDTADLYRYYDCTAEAEFLYGCVERTVDHDLPQEIEFLRRHDEAQRRIMEIVDMPDRIAQDLLMFLRQNKGKLSKNRREKEFVKLTNDEVERIEEIFSKIFAHGEADPTAT